MWHSCHCKLVARKYESMLGECCATVCDASLTTLTLLNYLFLFFIYSRQELPTQFPSSIDEKWSCLKCNHLINWASITNYLVDFSGILFGVKVIGKVYMGIQQPDIHSWYIWGSSSPTSTHGIYGAPAARHPLMVYMGLQQPGIHSWYIWDPAARHPLMVYMGIQQPDIHSWFHVCWVRGRILFPVGTRPWPSVGLTLPRRPRRWPSLNLVLSQL